MIELVISLFDGTDFPITSAIDVYDERDWRLNVLSELRAINTAIFHAPGPSGC